MASFRYGAQLNKDIYGRIYFNRNNRDSYQLLENQVAANDDWNLSGTGFCLDGDVGWKDSWTLQGDLYKGDGNQLIFPYWVPESPLPLTVEDQIDNKGYNLLGRWQHKKSETNSWTFQAYFDATEREEIYLGQEFRTIDLDFQHRFKPAEQHDFIWGLGYRNIADKFNNTYMVSLLPDEQTSEVFSGFVQDEISLMKDRLKITLGTKIEHNDYTGMEIQPSGRLLFKVNSNNNVWASVSRAVRTPSRVENSGQIVLEPLPVPPFPKIVVYGNPEIVAEEVLAYEAGYRYSASGKFSVDLAIFYNKYESLTDYIASSPISISFNNGLEGDRYGLEASSQWRPLSWLMAELNYSYINLEMDFEQTPGVPFSLSDIVAENSSPKHQLSLRSSVDLCDTITLNIWGRYVDEVKVASQAAYYAGIVIDEYVALDVNITWKPTPNLELMVAGQNLLESDHMEFINEYFIPPTEVGRSVYGKLTWEF